jgi:hypothetical protein
MRTRLTAAPGVVLALSLACSVRAQDPHNGFYLATPLSISSGYDQNFVSGSRELDDDVTILTGPTFEWMKSTHQTDFFINYLPEFDLYARNPSLDAWNHTAVMRVSHRLTSRLTLEAGDYFLSTIDPTRSIVNSLLLLPLGRFDQNAFYAGVGYRLNYNTKLSIRVENTVTKTDLTGDLASRLNDISTAATFTLDHRIRRVHRLSGSYSFLHASPLNSTYPGGSTNVQLLNVNYSYEVNPGLVLHAAGGVVGGDESAVLGTAAIEKRAGNVWFAAGYQRYLSFFGEMAPFVSGPPGAIAFNEGLTPTAVYQVASVRAWGQITPRIGIQGTAQRALNGVNLDGVQVRSMIGQIRLDYKMADHLTWFMRAEYYGQNVPQFSPFPSSRIRFFAGVEITLTRSPELARRRNSTSPDSDDSPSGDSIPPAER